MTSRYRVEYALKQHRRDELIEWIKGLLASPFVLHAVNTIGVSAVDEIKVTIEAQRRYAEIFSDIEKLIEDQIALEKKGLSEPSRLRQLVPSVGTFFTSLPLEKAFYIQDQRRLLSKRRLVAPSFNDVRIILNTAQVLELASAFHDNLGADKTLKLITFDGDVTLYEDGHWLEPDSPLIPYLIRILCKNIYVGVVTAAGYNDPSGEKYYSRLKGLIDRIAESEILTPRQKENLLIMGGESNYLYRFDAKSPYKLGFVETGRWWLHDWNVDDVSMTLDFAESLFKGIQENLNLGAVTRIIRKHRGVGIVPVDGYRFVREQLEEIVLTCDKKLKAFPVANNITFCAFNGGSDVWVDIGDKSLGVQSLQSFLKREDGADIKPRNTLHVGDQFAALGANDYKARLCSCTAWIASPTETKDCLHDLLTFIDEKGVI